MFATVKKRKHRYTIEVTYSSPVGMREGARGLQLALDAQAKPVWVYNNAIYAIEKLTVKEQGRR